MVSCRVDLVKEVGFLVKELVKEKDHEVNEDHGKIDFPGSFLTKSEFIFFDFSRSLLKDVMHAFYLL